MSDEEELGANQRAQNNYEASARIHRSMDEAFGGGGYAHRSERMDTRRKINNFGFLRLVFALLVILSHAPELLDGNRSRELATRLWGTMSFGEIAVDGFFVISGFLITQSFVSSRSVGSYLFKRVLRIYPAFLLATLTLLFVVAPMAGAHGPVEIWHALYGALTLSEPHRAGAFGGLAYPTLDGAMWSISYEFLCYLAVIFLGALGVLNASWFIAVASLTMLFATSFMVVPHWVVPHVSALGYLPYNVRTGGVFLVGVLFYIEKDRIPLRNDFAALAAVVLVCLMYFQVTAEPALAVFGGYLIFWLAEVEWLNPVSHRLKDDISYGVYLYAWPIMSLLIYYGIIRSPWPLAAATSAGAVICGWLSWKLVERPFLSLKGRSVSQTSVQ
jgi:peptidoglycan/LPS O-acetylase OafA/YrhL